MSRRLAVAFAVAGAVLGIASDRAAACDAIPIDVKGLTFESASVDIELRLPAGHELRQIVQLDWIRESHSGGRTQRVGLTLHLKVLDRPSEAGGVWMQATGERLWYRETGARRSWPDYDSASSDDPPPIHLPYEGTAFTAIFGHTMLVELDAHGRPVQLQSWETAFDALIASFRTMETVSEAEEARKRASFAETMLHSVFGAIRPALPDGPVRPGETWSDTRHSEQGNVELTATVGQLDEHTLHVGTVGRYSGMGGGGSATGTSVIDRRTGWTVSSALELSSGTFRHTIEVVTEK